MVFAIAFPFLSTECDIMFCNQCGTQLPENTKFCTSCGCPVESAGNQPVPAVSNVSEQPQKKPSSPPKTVLSIFCCIMIFILSLSALTLFTVRGCLHADKVENLLDSSNVGALVENANMEDIMKGMDADAFEKIYRKTPVGDYAINTVKEYTEYLLGGSKPKGVKADDVIDLMLDNQYEIEEITGESMTDEDLDLAYEFFGENGEENLGVFSSEVRTNSVLKTIRAFLSIYVILALLVLTAIFVFLLLKARGYRADSLVWISVPLILVSLLFGMFLAVKPILLSMLGGFDPVVTEVAGLILSNILGTVLINSGAVLLTGILLIAIFVAIKKKKIAQ